MFDPFTVLAVSMIYIGGLFLIALWVEQKAARGRYLVNNPIVYSLSLAVYCTTWTYYGSVGKAATSGMLFLTIYLGPTITVLLSWWLLRKLVRIKTAHRTTTIADIISARYQKSQLLAIIVTIVALAGVMPYISLQLKAIFATFDLLTVSSGVASPVSGGSAGNLLVGLIVVFTIIIGARRLDPTERHEGMVMAVAVESLVKLAAFLVAGIFVTYFLFGGFGDIFRRLAESPHQELFTIRNGESSSYLLWATYLVLGMSAILFLPRQFHIAVVENSDERHIRTAMWLFPLYMFLITLFVVPVAAGGLLMGYPAERADNFLLLLPLESGKPWLALLVFVGGFSAATGMIMISSMTLSTMITNNLMLPLIGKVERLSFLRRHLLKGRWISVAFVIILGYWFERKVGGSYMLVNIGIISFAAVLQFAPALLGGILWRGGNKKGALLGLSGGSLVWFYTLLLPSFVKSGWISQELLQKGPWGLEFLRPEQLFGLTGLDPVSHSVFWSLFLNVGLYVLGSLCFEQTEEEQRLAEEFVDALAPRPALDHVIESDADILVLNKRNLIEKLLGLYFPEKKAALITRKCMKAAGVAGKARISIHHLLRLHKEVEKRLAGSIGSAAARNAMKEGMIFSSRESRELSNTYGRILARLKVTPEELKSRIDYYKEREELLLNHARELEQKVLEREEQIYERKRAEGALAAEKERLAVTLRSIGDGVISMDTEGEIVLMNRVAEELSGWSHEEAVGKPFGMVFRIVDVDTRSPCENPVRRIVRSGDILSMEDMLLISREDEERVISASGAPIFTPERSVIGVVLGLRDVTEKRRLELDLLRAQKLESVGLLAGGIAHDFNNVLTAIITNLNLAKLDARPGENIHRMIEEAERASLRAHGLSQQLVTFSKGSEPIRRPMPLAGLLRAAASLALSGSPVICEFHIPENLWLAEVDNEQIHQVFNNLCINAVQASPKSGVIQIRAENMDLTGSGQPVPLRPGRYIRISIQDDGSGIRQEDLERIFDPYFTTKEEGSGLGLSVAFSIVNKHEGHIAVESELGRGSIFHVYLPAEKDRTLNEKAAPGKLVKGKGRILLMDDEDIIRGASGKMLRILGYEVGLAKDGTEALEMYESAMKSDAPFHAVIMDLTVPGGMGGKEAVKALLEKDPQAKVIVSSGYSSDPIMANFKDYGFASVLSKPYTIETFSRVLHEVISEDDPVLQKSPQDSE